MMRSPQFPCSPLGDSSRPQRTFGLSSPREPDFLSSATLGMLALPAASGRIPFLSECQIVRALPPWLLLRAPLFLVLYSSHHPFPCIQFSFHPIFFPHVLFCSRNPLLQIAPLRWRRFFPRFSGFLRLWGPCPQGFYFFWFPRRRIFVFLRIFFDSLPFCLNFSTGATLRRPFSLFPTRASSSILFKVLPQLSLSFTFPLPTLVFLKLRLSAPVWQASFPDRCPTPKLLACPLSHFPSRRFQCSFGDEAVPVQRVISYSHSRPATSHLSLSSGVITLQKPTAACEKSLFALLPNQASPPPSFILDHPLDTHLSKRYPHTTLFFFSLSESHRPLPLFFPDLFSFLCFIPPLTISPRWWRH